MSHSKKLLLCILSLVLILSLFSACQPRPAEVPIVEEETTIKAAPSFINLLPLPMMPDDYHAPFENGLNLLAQRGFADNDDVIGWIRIEGTTMDDVVMYKALDDENADKFYYLHKDFNEKYLYAGTYFIDYRSRFEGGREGLSRNNVVYGHSMSDDPYGTLFSPLKRYKEESFAKSNPYVYFSTLEEDMAWEVFAMFTTNTNFLYNTPNPNDGDFVDILKNARERSLFNYDVEVGADDTILTLSTCVYEYEGQKLSYPNSYRYVVMAKLVPANQQLKEAASLTPNTDTTTL